MTDRIPRVILQPRKARPFFGRHPWVFEKAIERVEGDVSPGQLVQLHTHDKEFIAYGLFNPNSKIRVRLYSWDKEKPFDESMLGSRIERAIRMRHEDLGLGDPAGACRLVYSESDGLSGLVVDRYADILVVQFTSLAMAKFESFIITKLQEILQPRGIYRRTERGIGELEGLDTDDGPLAGDIPEEPITIKENGLELLVDPKTGQKTGAFLDQRDNRTASLRYSAGRSVLDLFCYGGAFSLNAAKNGGASSVTGIDASGTAILLAQENAKRNGIQAEYFKEDAAAALAGFAREKRRFGMIFCDPPKFARTAGAVAGAIRGYEQTNRQAIELLEPGGILVSCSCSGHVSAEQFLEILAQSAQNAKRELQILEQRGQAADHPVSLFCLETSYLKCVIARCVE